MNPGKQYIKDTIEVLEKFLSESVTHLATLSELPDISEYTPDYSDVNSAKEFIHLVINLKFVPCTSYEEAVKLTTEHVNKLLLTSRDERLLWSIRDYKLEVDPDSLKTFNDRQRKIKENKAYMAQIKIDLLKKDLEM
jgi:hypothetical protein